MKLFKQWLLIAASFLCIHTAGAQQKPVKFANGDFIPSGSIRKQSFQLADIAGAKFGSQYFVLVQFDELPSTDLQQKLNSAGMFLEAYYPGNAFLAVVQEGFDFAKAQNFRISSIDIVPALYKTDRKITGLRQSGDKMNALGLAIRISSKVAFNLAKDSIVSAGAKIVTLKFSNAGVILVQYDPAIVSTLAALPFVSSLSVQALEDKPLNYRSRAAHGVSGLNAAVGKNLNGRGVTVGVGDNADVSTHLDFTGRLINRSPATAQNHGTHTAGSTAGAGLINPVNRGTAAKATLINQYFSDIIVNAPTYISDYNMVLSNNSYHSAEEGCIGEGEYNILSFYADQQLRNNSQLLHVFAAGNDGASTCSPYPTSFGTVKSGWQCGKNVLTVGAIRIDNYTIASFSGRGPVVDGRLKPEISANGNEVLSTNANNTYGLNSGTSMACPQVTGALTLMYERYRQLNGGTNPKSALMKALVCNTAEDLGNAGPDYTFGFGMLNARRAVQAIENNSYLISNINNATSNSHQISIPDNTRRVKIMLYWADPAANDNASIALVNDLDLVVSEPTAVIHRPLILNSNPSSVNSTAVEGIDRLNNIEQVTIENPAAGTYTIVVSGTTVPLGPQEYIVTYEVISNSVALEYPAGGETLVPGEAETLRWSGFGNEANSFNIEFSTDNGTSWNNIATNIAGSRRSFAWTVPSVVTNNALVRVTRNGTGYTDQSKKPFIILGQPQVTATNACEGAVLLDWGTVNGATSYDICMLQGDSMSVIDNTTSLSYLVTGLDKNKVYWFAVAARNGTSSGRRSVSVNIQPATGPCSLAAFVSDLKVDSILEPNTARQFFSSAGDAVKPVKISIKNTSMASISGPFTVSYTMGGATVTENVNTTISAGSSFTYVFSGSYPIDASGFDYNFKAWVTKADDGNRKNDTAYKNVKYINNDPITAMPVSEDFESMPVVETQVAGMAIGGNKRLDFTASRSRGRLRTFVNSGFALAGNRALTLDQVPYNATSTADSATFSYNLSNYTGKQLRLDFYYKNHGQSNLTGNRVWIRGSESNAWVQAYNLFDNQAELGGWKKALVNVSEVLAAAVPPQIVTSTFQLKLGEQGNFSANSPYPVVDIDDGYTFDNLVITEAINDVSALSIVSPDKSGCGLNSNSALIIKIKNHNNIQLQNVQVSYKVNNGPVVTETIAALNANQTLDYVFTQRPNFTSYIDYNINVWVKYGTDNYAANDSILNFTLHNSPIITSYPYREDFESGDGYYYAAGTNSTWQWGSPAKTIINKSANGSKAWVTNVAGNYADNETSYLYSPCFNLNGLRKPVLSFSHIFDIEQDYDYTWVEYSTDGKTWQKLGNVNSGTNWYDNATLRNWRLSKTKWHVASIDIPVTNTTVKFRFVFSSDGGVTQEGVAVDDIRVHEKRLIADSIPVGQSISNLVNGSQWIPFNWGDSVAGLWYALAEINANGQNLGVVTVTPFKDVTGTVRNSNDYYYGSRNYVLRAESSPTNPVKLRLFFTDEEANALLNATGCASCIAPYDPYELGITRYHGAFAEEDSTLLNNRRGYYQFILPDSTTIIPHSNGYYAEFTVKNFGEYWFSKGNITPPAANACAGNTVTYSAAAQGATYQWQVDNGSGYTNLVNEEIYNGATSATLKITDAPTSFTGYQYRCLVDGVAGPANQLRFVNYWAGSVSSDWFTAANWSCEQVPDENTDVVIPGGIVKYPILTGNTAIRSIQIQQGAPVMVNAGVNLDVRGR